MTMRCVLPLLLRQHALSPMANCSRRLVACPYSLQLKIRRLVELNVLEQCMNLFKTSVVQSKMKAGGCVVMLPAACTTAVHAVTYALPLSFSSLYLPVERDLQRFDPRHGVRPR